VLDYLWNRPDDRTLIGQQNFPGLRTFYTDQIVAISGNWPAVGGCDLGFAPARKDSIHECGNVIKEAISQWNAGSLVTLTYHQHDPSKGEIGWSQGGVINTGMTDAQFYELVTPGYSLYDTWLAHVDNAAFYLKQFTVTQ
jgi:mannan endo-1,4-beta-mannosidase